jgi:hypothetical protein
VRTGLETGPHMSGDSSSQIMRLVSTPISIASKPSQKDGPGIFPRIGVSPLSSKQKTSHKPVNIAGRGETKHQYYCVITCWTLPKDCEILEAWPLSLIPLKSDLIVMSKTLQVSVGR